MCNERDARRTARRGFTLLEIIIAVVLFTSGVVIMLGLLSKGVVGSSDAENTIIAINLAQQRMEEIRNFAFENITAEAKTVITAFPNFQRQVEVDDPVGAPAIDDLKRVTVTVYWTAKGGELSESIVTNISNN